MGYLSIIRIIVVNWNIWNIFRSRVYNDKEESLLEFVLCIILCYLDISVLEVYTVCRL